MSIPIRVIFETDDQMFRITEHTDLDADLDNLKGDTYNPKINTDIDPEKLKREEREFEALVDREGVFGYVLERWNPAPGKGYEHVDSCWGFVGAYLGEGCEGHFNHYIVDELKNHILTLRSKR